MLAYFLQFGVYDTQAKDIENLNTIEKLKKKY
jgi:hypothetical protein